MHVLAGEVIRELVRVISGDHRITEIAAALRSLFLLLGLEFPVRPKEVNKQISDCGALPILGESVLCFVF